MICCTRHGGSCCTVLRTRVTLVWVTKFRAATFLYVHSAESTATTRVVVEFNWEHPVLGELFVGDLVGVVL